MTSKLLETVENTESVTKFYQLKWEIIKALKNKEIDGMIEKELADFIVRLEQQTSLPDFFRMKREIVEALNKAETGPKKGLKKDKTGIGE